MNNNDNNSADYSIRYTSPRKETRLYRIYKKIKERCYNPERDNYKYYGGKGIKMCNKWKMKIIGFPAFHSWSLANGYKDGLTIDRKNSKKDYSPDNCRWITGEMNSRYKSSTKLNVEAVKLIRTLYGSGKFTQSKLAKLFKVSCSNVHGIINNRTWRNV